MNDARIKRVIDGMRRGVGDVQFNAIADNLILGNGSIADPYMCLADFESYMISSEQIRNDYKDRELWLKKSLSNIAGAGFFAADRSIGEYAENIWHIKPVID